MGSVSHQVDIDHVLSRLTTAEKISLLAGKDWWRTHTIRRDGGVFVPQIKTTDGPNGARGGSYVSAIRAACFPCATSLGATFDKEAVFVTGQQIAREAISKAANVLLAPTLNVIRSPRGGRNYETYSEDPTVLGVLAAAFVNGCQSLGIAAAPKHFVANDAETRRKVLTAEVDEQTLRELYLLPFQILLKESAPLCIMTPYNRVNGVYVADSEYLVEDVLRGEWGFDGLVMSDWMGMYSTAQSLLAGVDLEMPGPTKWRGKHLEIALKKGEISIKDIDRSARRVLQLAERLGRWDDPEEAPEVEVNDPVRDGIIRDTAADGMVLLKNSGNILPISTQSTVALIGQFAHTVSLGGGGSARVEALHAISPLQGFHNVGMDCRSHEGVPVFGAVPVIDPSIMLETGVAAATYRVPQPVKLEWFNGPKIGERLAYKEMVAKPEYMIKEAWPTYLDRDYCSRITFDIIPQSTGNHLLSVITTGTATCYIDGQEVFHREQETKLRPESFYFFKSTLERRFTYAMNGGQRYTIVLESWPCDPDLLSKPPLNNKMYQGSGVRFTEFVDIPKAISDATDVAKTAEYAIVCVGNTNEIESEGYDRASMDLPGEQYDLIAAVAAQNPRTIVVNFSGAPVTLTQFISKVPVFLQAWFPGQECGDALAQVVTGKSNAGGRLPFSWPIKDEDNPSWGNFPADDNDVLRYEERLDVGYRYYDRTDRPDPLFPFGFGLSYTTFDILEASITGDNIFRGVDGNVSVSCVAKNTGNRFGKLAVQFYVQMPETEIGNRRPVKELKAFTKLSLESGERKTATARLDKYAVSFYDSVAGCWRAAKGTYAVLVGTSSRDIAQRVEFEVAEDFTWTRL